MGRPAILKIDIIADAKGVNKGVADTESGLNKLGSKAKLAGAAVAAGLVVGGIALGKFAASAVSTASDAEQSMGAVQSVFGKAAAAVVKFTDDSAMRLGLSKNDYRELAAVVGSQLQSMGKSQAESAKETDRLISVGADLAATFGGSVADAVGAVGSLLRGERDPIERYGVAIKDADIQARLAAQGQDKLEGAAKRTATANATLALLTDQTKNSLGAFGRESNTLAGTQERLRARLDDVKAEIGAKLLPIATKFAQWLLKEGVPALERFIAKVEANRDEIINFGAGVGKTLATVGQGFLLFLQGVLIVFAQLSGAFVKQAQIAFSWARQVLGAFESALGWLPGYKEKFQVAGIVLDTYEKLALKKLKSASSGFHTAADAAGDAASAVGGLRGQIDRLTSKTITVTTIQKTVYVAERDGKGGGIQAGVGGMLDSRPRLTDGWGGGTRERSLTTAALGDSSSGLALLARTPGGAVTVIDGRTIDARVIVNGALDPVAVARQLEDVLARQNRRLGRTSTLTGTS